MGISSCLGRLLRHQKAEKSGPQATGPLREFVYLDEVSVYSILASRTGAIATEFSEEQESIRSSELGGSIGVGVAATSAGFDSKLQATQMQASQVLRKAIVQTSFKELYEMEHGSLGLTPISNSTTSPLQISSMADLENGAQANGNPWIIDPRNLRRGDLIEVEVELETDPIYRMVSIIATFQELIEDNEFLFGNAVSALLPQMRSIAQVLERLLVGLVPIRGRLIDYRWAKISGQEKLIHRRLLEQLPASVKLKPYPAIVVGVAQRDLFWKDIRRILFSKAHYTVFCRLAVGGLAETWHPVKLADVLAGITPEIDNSIKQFSDNASQALTGVTADSEESSNQPELLAHELIECFADLLVKHHGRETTPRMLAHVFAGIPAGHDWLNSVAAQRTVLHDVTQRIDNCFNVETSRKDAHDLRETARREVGMALATPTDASSRKELDGTNGSIVEERFLDAEIIAIYW